MRSRPPINSPRENARQNCNLPILAEHIHTFLLRHHDFHHDVGQHELAGQLDPARLQVALNAPNQLMAWIGVKATALEKAYTTYNITQAGLAAGALVVWLRYCFQPGHTDHNEFAANLRKGAEDSAYQLWVA